jgi:hypothetical protein
MSFQRITHTNPQSQLPFQERPSVQTIQTLLGMNQLAVRNISEQPNAEQTQLALYQERTALMLNQTLTTLDEQNNDVQAEHARTLRQAQDTILNLQKMHQSLIRENAQVKAQVTVLESQNNQMNIAHQVDMNGALQRIKTLEGTLEMKSKELEVTSEKLRLKCKELEVTCNEKKRSEEILTAYRKEFYGFWGGR